MEDQLTSKDLQIVKDTLWEARTLWKNIGDAIGIDDETLKSISKDQANQDDCLRECLAKWLSGGAEASAAQRQPRSWCTIVNALRTPSVNRQQLATEIEKKYRFDPKEQPHHGKQQSNQEQIPIPEQLQVLPYIPIASVSPEVREDLHQLVRRDVNKMKLKFSSLQTNIRRKISDISDLKTHVIGMGILGEDDEILVKRADNTDDIFMILTRYWSFLDYENFESIVVNMCGMDSKQIQEWSQYKDEVQMFCERCRVYELPGSSLEDSNKHERMNKLIVRLNLDDPVIKRIKHLKEVIANILGVQASKLIIENIEGGSIEVTFLIAASLGKELFVKKSLTTKQLYALSEAGVTSMELESSVTMNVMSTESKHKHYANRLVGKCPHWYCNKTCTCICWIINFMLLSLITAMALRAGSGQVNQLEILVMEIRMAADILFAINHEGVREIHILVTGKTGTGKSTLINGLIGDNVTEKGSSLDPTTTKVAQFNRTVQGVSTLILESPGLQDGTENEKEYLLEMEQKCKKLDLVLYTMRMTDQRLHSDDVEAMKKLTTAFGPMFWERAMFVLTFANEVRNPEKPDDDDESRIYFENKLNRWKEILSNMLERELNISREVARHVPVVPAGYYKKIHLPGRRYWFSQFWKSVLDRMKDEGYSLMLNFNNDRFRHAYEITSEELMKDLHEQPIIIIKRPSNSTYSSPASPWSVHAIMQSMTLLFLVYILPIINFGLDND